MTMWGKSPTNLESSFQLLCERGIKFLIFNPGYCWASYFSSLIVLPPLTHKTMRAATDTWESLSIRKSQGCEPGHVLWKLLFSPESMVRKATLQAIFISWNQSIKKSKRSAKMFFSLEKSQRKQSITCLFLKPKKYIYQSKFQGFCLF